VTQEKVRKRDIAKRGSRGKKDVVYGRGSEKREPGGARPKKCQTCAKGQKRTGEVKKKVKPRPKLKEDRKCEAKKKARPRVTPIGAGSDRQKKRGDKG